MLARAEVLFPKSMRHSQPSLAGSGFTDEVEQGKFSRIMRTGANAATSTPMLTACATVPSPRSPLYPPPCESEAGHARFSDLPTRDARLRQAGVVEIVPNSRELRQVPPATR